ncbi:MAG: rod shape-determining protein MreC [Prevotella sp.]|nr:rod shape-determining protein MreC [Prevotella sp.]MCM1074694.1 rod shape-determining protein MreC [Ruminococcus sp.]
MLFVVYIAIGCVLLFNGNAYQQSTYMTSANAVSSSVYETSTSVSGYFNLRSINESLQARNASLENELLNLQNELDHLRTLLPPDSTDVVYTASKRFEYVIASVINNSVTKPKNYFTINKGFNDGIAPGMGVVSHTGVAGIVGSVGPNASRVISLLNMTQHFSVKVKNTNTVGSLEWQEGNPDIAYVGELPRHIVYHIGDTIVTSGYSTTFPEGIPVGVVMSQIRTNDDNFFTLKVHLATNFKELNSVRIIKDNYKNEIDSLMQFDATEEL